MTIHELLDGAGLVQAASPDTLSLPVSGLAYDSRHVAPGTLFFAFAGSKVDGGRFANDALARGACAVVYETAPATPPGHPYVVVAHGRHALAQAAKRFFNKPDESIEIIGFTGTNGKSTGTMLADGILQHAGHKTSLINTIGYHVGGAPRPAVNTTPESLDVYKIAAETRDLGGKYLSMEISSHALALGRVEYLKVAAAVFTNLTRDHLDFHLTMEAYGAAKARLFGPDFAPVNAILNADEPFSNEIKTAPQSRRLTYGLAAGADYRATDIQSTFAGLRFTIPATPKSAPAWSAISTSTTSSPPPPPAIRSASPGTKSPPASKPSPASPDASSVSKPARISSSSSTTPIPTPPSPTSSASPASSSTAKAA